MPRIHALLMMSVCMAPVTGHAQTLQERIAAHPRRPELAPGQSPGEQISFKSGKYTLEGMIYKPQGSGPFPAIIWNHGSEKNPNWQPELAAFYNGQGFVFFVPHRHGHAGSPGEYIGDLNDRILAQHKDHEEDAWKEMVPLHEVYNADVAAAVEWLKARPYVDKGRIVMSGVSYGGIQTLISAEKGMGVRCFISFAPAAMSWKMTVLRERMLQAIARAKAPIFLLQAENDYSLGPSEVLGAAIKKKGPPNQAKVYPPFGTTNQMGHASFATFNIGTEVWGPDAMKFIHTVLE
jgi:dienelactone hydrolase